MNSQAQRRLFRWLPPLALLLLAALFFWKLGFTNLILARGDTFLYFYPYWDYRTQTLLAGRLPLWNPLLFMGAPFLANSQAGVLYPFNWPLAVFAAPVAVKIAVLFHVGLAALGTYSFARRALGQTALGALLAGLLFALGGYVTAQVEHVNQLQGLAWLPWVLLFAHRLATPLPPQRRLQASLALAVLFTLQLFAGHTQTLFISAVGAGVYVLVFCVASFRQKPTADGLHRFATRAGRRPSPLRYEGRPTTVPQAVAATSVEATYAYNKDRLKSPLRSMQSQTEHATHNTSMLAQTA